MIGIKEKPGTGTSATNYTYGVEDEENKQNSVVEVVSKQNIPTVVRLAARCGRIGMTS